MKYTFLKIVSMTVGIIWLCLAICGCSQQITTQTPVLTTTSVPEIFEDPSHSGGDVPISYIYDLDEYRSYITSSNYPDDFVHYDGVSKLGEFVTFGYYPPRIDCYWYILRNGETEYRLSIKPKSKFTIPETDSRGVLTTNNLMEITPMCDVQIGTAWYYFKNGVYFIRWTDETCLYTLSGFNQSSLPQKDTILDRLIHLDTAPEAIEELRQDIAKNQSKH